MGLYRDSCGLVGDPTLSKLLLRQGLYRLYNSHNVLQAWESPTGEAPFISDTNITKRMGPALHRFASHTDKPHPRLRKMR